MTMIDKASTERPVVAPAGRLKGKVALITGGSRGIGLSIARAYAAEGARLMIAARSGDEVKEALDLLKTHGAEVTGVRIDLSSQANCDSLQRTAIRTYGKVDILVNNAAILGPRTAIVDYRVEDWKAVMTTNLDAVYWMTRAVLGSMIPENSGSIINVISGVAERGRRDWGAYSVSKAGVLNLTQVVAEEVTEYDVRVNALDPGATRTDMRADAYPREDPTTLPSPNDIMNAFIYLACDASKGLTGSTIKARDWIGREF